MWTTLPSNVAGRATKTITASLMFIGYYAGNATGAQLFSTDGARRYIPGLTGCAVMYGFEVCLMIAWRSWYAIPNRRRARKVAAIGLSEEESGGADAG